MKVAAKKFPPGQAKAEQVEDPTTLPMSAAIAVQIIAGFTPYDLKSHRLGKSLTFIGVAMFNIIWIIVLPTRGAEIFARLVSK